MWMQNRYYRNYGVIAGFLTNIQNLEVDEPEDYSEETVNALVEQSYIVTDILQLAQMLIVRFETLAIVLKKGIVARKMIQKRHLEMLVRKQECLML